MQLEDYVILLTEAAFIKKRPSSPHTSFSFFVLILSVMSGSFRKVCSNESWLEYSSQDNVPAFQPALEASMCETRVANRFM